MEPSSLVHPAFGRAPWIDSPGWYVGRYQVVDGPSIAVSIDPFTDHVPGQEPRQVEDPDRLAHSVAERLSDLVLRLEEVKAFAATELLTCFNDGDWCEGSPIDATTFASRLTLTSVTIDQDLRAELFFDDGDLFWGHSVIVFSDEEGRPCSTDLFG